MKATKRLISVLLISVMLLGCLTACGATQGSSTDSKKATNPVVLTFATEMATGTPEVQAAEIFAKNVYDKTNGEVASLVNPPRQSKARSLAILIF